MSAPVLVVCDLDRTLIYSERAAGRTVRAPGPGDAPLICVEMYQEAPQSFMTSRALSRLAELDAAAVLVPATTRTRAQLARIVLPGVRPRYAIAGNGGLLLIDGEPDPDWTARVRATLAGSSAPLETVWARITATCDPRWMLRMHRAEELFCFGIVDRAAVPAEALQGLTTWCSERGWELSLQGRKLYFVPSALTKSAAMAELAGRVGAGRVLAAGDSLLDAPMLLAADAGVRPGHGELADAGWTAPHVTALPARGVQAGEEIVDWLLEQARGTVRTATPSPTPTAAVSGSPPAG
jgi:hypothetical protein